MFASKRFAIVLTVLAAAFIPSVAMACLWDYDTMKMERSRFPSTLELITGKFLRHSPEFYQWRIDDRLKRLETDAYNVQLLDDLAVAYDKTGQHDKAIATALKTETIRPNRYETAANLGTFYFHSGKFDEGLPHIERALQINPNAHFGREKYQKLLVEYMLDRKRAGRTELPIAWAGTTKNDINRSSTHIGEPTFYTFRDYLKQRNEMQGYHDVNHEAIKGVLGMMKFGNYNSPVLLEALGTLLTDGPANPNGDAKMLAGRAFLKASYEVKGEASRKAYRELASQTISYQVGGVGLDRMKLDALEADFQKELAEAKLWYTELEEREKQWIRDGKNPEVEFDKLYQTEPELAGMDVWEISHDTKVITLLVVAGIIMLAMFLGSIAAIFWLIRWQLRRYRLRVAQQANPA